MIKTISISDKADALIRAESERTGLKQSTIIEQAILARLTAEPLDVNIKNSPLMVERKMINATQAERNRKDETTDNAK